MGAIQKFIQNFLGGLIWGIIFKIILCVIVLILLGKLTKRLFANVDAHDVGKFASSLIGVA